MRKMSALIPYLKPPPRLNLRTCVLCWILGAYVKTLYVTSSHTFKGRWKKFSVESLGIGEQEELSNYDEQMVELLRRSISEYYLHFSWDFDKISCVPSNHSVALHILDRVERRVERDLLYQEYLELFREQETVGIIEDIFFSTSVVQETYLDCTKASPEIRSYLHH